MEKFGKLLLFLVLLVFLFYGIRTIFTGSITEIIIISVMGILTVLGFTHWKKLLGERLFLFVSLLSLAYLIFIWSLGGSLYLTLLFISLVIFLLAFPKRQPKMLKDDGEPTISEQPHSVVFEPPKQQEPGKEASVVKHFSPGLYVASSNGSVFHAPTCNWAKKVAERRRIWLQDKDDARGKGYNAHNCVS